METLEGQKVVVTMRDGAIVQIRDFRYVPYITADAAIAIPPSR